MNLALIEELVGAMPQFCTQDEMVEYIYTTLRRAGATKDALGQLHHERQKLWNVHENDRGWAWHLQFDAVQAKIEETKTLCRHMGGVACVICGRLT